MERYRGAVVTGRVLRGSFWMKSQQSVLFLERRSAPLPLQRRFVYSTTIIILPLTVRLFRALFVHHYRKLFGKPDDVFDSQKLEHLLARLPTLSESERHRIEEATAVE